MNMMDHIRKQMNQRNGADPVTESAEPVSTANDKIRARIAQLKEQANVVNEDVVTNTTPKQAPVKLGGKTPIDLNPQLAPVKSKDADIQPKKEKKTKEVTEGLLGAIGGAIKAVAKHTALTVAHNVAHNVGVSPRAVHSVIRGSHAGYHGKRATSGRSQVVHIHNHTHYGSGNGGSSSGGQRQKSSGIASSPAPQQSSTMSRQNLASQLKSNGNNLRKVVASPSPTSSSSPQPSSKKFTRSSLLNNEKQFRRGLMIEALGHYQSDAEKKYKNGDHTHHFDAMIDHHGRGEDAKASGDKSLARMHFRTRDHHFAQYVHQAPQGELKKLNMPKLKEMLSIRESIKPLDNLLRIRARLLKQQEGE